MSFETILWREGKVVMLNQLLLPHEVRYEEYETCQQVADAIRTMVIRGAPAIGIAAAMGYALGATQSKAKNFEELERELEENGRVLAATRPTAVNLFWAIERMKHLAYKLREEPLVKIQEALIAEGQKVLEEDIAINRRLGEYGAQFVQDGDTILTHCNAGALATGGYGTATAMIRVAHEQGKKIHVLADETRPYLQGARLTAWELMEDNISVEILCDNMAGQVLKSGEVALCTVGTDRTAGNGDVANKIGTYMVALAARANDVPFYVCAPTSSIDMSLTSGEQIPIEERSPQEVMTIGEHHIPPKGARARHIAFDVTPSRYVTAIITENGVAHAPYTLTLPLLVHPEEKPSL